MRTATPFFPAMTAWLVMIGVSHAQDGQLRPAEVAAQRFERSAPQVGDRLPDVTAFDAEGESVPLRSLKGHYTVLTFGCLT